VITLSGFHCVLNCRQEIVSLEANERDDVVEEEDMDGDDDDDTGEEIEMERPKKSTRVTNNFNGPYQPNYGNQYNIDHLTLSIPTQGLTSSLGKIMPEFMVSWVVGTLTYFGTRHTKHFYTQYFDKNILR